MTPIDSPAPPGRFARLRSVLRALYHGRSPEAIRFRLGVLVIDFAIIAFFIVAPVLRDTAAFLAIDYAIAVLLALDLVARAVSWRGLRSWIRQPIVWVDLFVLATLLAPQLLFNLGFLRILRLWSLFHSEFFWSTVGRRYDDTRWEDVARTLSTLVTFVFVVTGFVYTGFAGTDSGVEGYVDALYFTVATLTTTGFGDITLPGMAGKLLSIVTMIVGISLFARLAQTLFRPNKVQFDCPTCGLQRHDPDAVHCKACGTLLKIPNGDD